MIAAGIWLQVLFFVCFEIHRISDLSSGVVNQRRCISAIVIDLSSPKTNMCAVRPIRIPKNPESNKQGIPFARRGNGGV